MFRDQLVNISLSFKEPCHKLMQTIYMINERNGFWDDGNDRNVGEMIALIHSELSEALEGHRKQKQDDHLPQYSSLEVELADTIIRIFDMAYGLDLNILDPLFEKVAYNQSRPHKHGKNY